MPTSLEEIQALRKRTTELYAEAGRIREKAVKAEGELKEAIKEYWRETYGKPSRDQSADH
jgi:hypothetical protein